MPNWAFWRRPKPFSREESLASVPLRNPAAEVEETDEGEMRLAIPTRPKWWARPLARLFYMPKKRRIVLDEIGRYVWELCDGRVDPQTGTVRGNDVRHIIAALAERYKLHRKEAEVSLVAYLRQLAQRGVILIAVRKAGVKADQRGR